jgi:hypothetical protein
MPKEWITNYENCHQRHELVQSSGLIFQTLSDGRVKATFTLPKPEPPRHSFSQFMLLPYDDIERKHQKNFLVNSFLFDGSPISTDKINGHFIWDVDPPMCDPGCSCDEPSDEDLECENPRSRRARKWRAKHAQTPCKTYSPHDDKDDI